MSLIYNPPARQIATPVHKKKVGPPPPNLSARLAASPRPYHKITLTPNALRKRKISQRKLLSYDARPHVIPLIICWGEELSGKSNRLYDSFVPVYLAALPTGRPPFVSTPAEWGGRRWGVCAPVAGGPFVCTGVIGVIPDIHVH